MGDLFSTPKPNVLQCPFVQNGIPAFHKDQDVVGQIVLFCSFNIKLYCEAPCDAMYKELKWANEIENLFYIFFVESVLISM